MFKTFLLYVHLVVFKYVTDMLYKYISLVHSKHKRCKSSNDMKRA